MVRVAAVTVAALAAAAQPTALRSTVRRVSITIAKALKFSMYTVSKKEGKCIWLNNINAIKRYLYKSLYKNKSRKSDLTDDLKPCSSAETREPQHS